MQIIARIEETVQVGPYDYRVQAVTKSFEDTATVKEVIAWANTRGNYTLNQIELTQPI